MPPKIKPRATGDKATVSSVKPLLMHDVTNPKASANAASRRRITAIQPASGSANHARHHASPRTQS
jgi:hypothetical protein